MSIVTQNKSKHKPSNQRVVDWQPLRVIPPGERGLPRGYCESCSLYIWSTGGYRIPNIRGVFCSIACVESRLFGTAHCRQCGDPLQRSTGQRFCGDVCRKKPLPKTFGDGSQLLTYLSNRHPSVYGRVMSGRGVGSCLNCNGRIEGKRNGSKYCSDACKVAYSRKSRTTRKAGNNRNNVLQTQELREGVLTAPYLPPVQANEAVEIAGERV